jgi:hypothetical protein
MNLIVIKIFFCLVLMIAFLIMAFITKDISNSQLFASLGIITGTFGSRNLSPQK